MSHLSHAVSTVHVRSTSTFIMSSCAASLLYSSIDKTQTVLIIISIQSLVPLLLMLWQSYSLAVVNIIHLATKWFDMLNLFLWLVRNGYLAEIVFLCNSQWNYFDFKSYPYPPWTSVSFETVLFPNLLISTNLWEVQVLSAKGSLPLIVLVSSVICRSLTIMTSSSFHNETVHCGEIVMGLLPLQT